MYWISILLCSLHFINITIRVFQVEMFGRSMSPGQSGGGWVIVARRVPGPTYTQHYLQPNLSYTFLVRAENSHGLSPPSPPSPSLSLLQALPPQLDPGVKEARASLSAGHVVELTAIQPVSSTSIKLGWEVSSICLWDWWSRVYVNVSRHNLRFVARIWIYSNVHKYL